MFLLSLEIATLAAGISIFVNYCIGKPGSAEFLPHEIFSRYTVWLSRMRLIKEGLYETYLKQYLSSLKKANQQHEQDALGFDIWKVYYNAAEPFFTWERAVGMCVICTGYWISLIVWLIFTISNHFGFEQSFLYLVQIIVFSHIIIRLLAKII